MIVSQWKPLVVSSDGTVSAPWPPSQTSSKPLVASTSPIPSWPYRWSVPHPLVVPTCPTHAEPPLSFRACRGISLRLLSCLAIRRDSRHEPMTTSNGHLSFVVLRRMGDVGYGGGRRKEIPRQARNDRGGERQGAAGWCGESRRLGRGSTVGGMVQRSAECIPARGRGVSVEEVEGGAVTRVAVVPTPGTLRAGTVIGGAETRAGATPDDTPAMVSGRWAPGGAGSAARP